MSIAHVEPGNHFSACAQNLGDFCCIINESIYIHYIYIYKGLQ